ncbi:MAG TPA: hypothetical protein VKV19_11160 [Ktedonobacteraceae bacterium]|nr:hypothetical protein [Ktedonobacteraceae bacterium]
MDRWHQTRAGKSPARAEHAELFRIVPGPEQVENRAVAVGGKTKQPY